MPPDKNNGPLSPGLARPHGPRRTARAEVTSRVAFHPRQGALDGSGGGREPPGDGAAGSSCAGRSRATSSSASSGLEPRRDRLVEFDPDTFPQLSSRIRVFGGRIRWAITPSTTSSSRPSHGPSRSPGRRIRHREVRLRWTRRARACSRGTASRADPRGGWASDMCLRQDSARLTAEMAYVKEI